MDRYIAAEEAGLDYIGVNPGDWLDEELLIEELDEDLDEEYLDNMCCWPEQRVLTCPVAMYGGDVYTIVKRGIKW